VAGKAAVGQKIILSSNGVAPVGEVAAAAPGIEAVLKELCIS
jgi:hypothetical protein